MVSPKFNVVFAVSVCSFLNGMLLQNPPPVDPAGTLYYKESPNIDFAIRMAINKPTEKKLKIMIYYDTLTDTATEFFKNHITAALIDDLTKCDVIEWNFSPCSMTKIAQGGTLDCPKGADQCHFDQVHGCLDTAFNWHQDKMGKFLVCANTPGKSTDQCNEQEGGLIPDDMKECVRSARGAGSCNASYGNYHHQRTVRNDANTATLPDAFTKFKEATCAVLAQAQLSCKAVCGP